MLCVWISFESFGTSASSSTWMESLKLFSMMFVLTQRHIHRETKSLEVFDDVFVAAESKRKRKRDTDRERETDRQTETYRETERRYGSTARTPIKGVRIQSDNHQLACTLY